MNDERNDDVDDIDGNDSWPWEEGLARRLDEILMSGEVEEGDAGRVVIFSGADFDVQECSDIDELYDALIDYGDDYLASRVPWDEGEPVFSTDSSSAVMDAIARFGVESLFGDHVYRHKDQLLFDFDASSTVVRVDFESINSELIKYLAVHPDAMLQLHHRKFEELIADLLKAQGYEIELTKRTRDGGRDIHVLRKESVGTILTLVECKRYTPKRKVGVEIVRQLLGVVDLERATNALVATTSFFTKDAHEEQRRARFRISLADQDELAKWLKGYKSGSGRS